MFRYAFLALAFLSLSAHADDAFTFNFHGFVGTTSYYQTSPDFLLNGQGPLLVQNTNSAPTFGFDVRQTRMNLSATGPKVMGAATSAVIESDFFGLDTPGNYGEVSIAPRLRLAYTELKWDDWTVRVGQDWQLLWTQSATSQAHMGYPLNYFSGEVAWREPGVGVYYKMASGASMWNFAVQVEKADWQSPFSFGTSTKQNLNVDAGQMSAQPAVEARVKWTLEDNAMAYIVGHFNKVVTSQQHNQPYQGNANDVVSPAVTANRDFSVSILKIGGRYSIAGFTLMAEAYSGRNLAPLIGELNQFPIATDVNEIGGWAQLSYQINDPWMVALDYGTAQPNGSDAAAANMALRNNTVWTLMVQHKEGNFAIAPELSTIRTALANGDVAHAQQFALSANYFF